MKRVRVIVEVGVSGRVKRTQVRDLLSEWLPDKAEAAKTELLNEQLVKIGEIDWSSATVRLRSRAPRKPRRP